MYFCWLRGGGKKRKEKKKKKKLLERGIKRKKGGQGGNVTASLDFHRARRSSPGKDVKSIDGES